MRRVLRALLTGILALAIPLQGMAASAMGFCGPGHDRAARADAHAHAHAQPQALGTPGAVDASLDQGLASDSTHAGDGHAAAGRDHGVQPVHPVQHHEAYGHAAAGGLYANHQTSADDTAAGLDVTPHHGKPSCSACAACCVGLALPVHHVLTPPSTLTRFEGLPVLEPATSPQPDGLDRPPRATLA